MSDENKGRSNYNADDMIDNLFEEFGLNDFMKKFDSLMSDDKSKDTEDKSNNEENVSEGIDTKETEPEDQPSAEKTSAEDDPFAALDRKTAEAKNTPSLTETVKSHADLYFDSEADKEESFDIVMQNPYAEPINRPVEEEPQESYEPDGGEGEYVEEPVEEEPYYSEPSYDSHDGDDPFDELYDFADSEPGTFESEFSAAESSESDLDSMFDFDHKGFEEVSDIAPQAENVYSNSEKKKGFKGWLTANAIPVKGDSGGEVVRKIFFVVSIITIIVCLCVLSNIYIIEPYRAGKDISSMSEQNNNTPTEISVQDEMEKYPDVDFPEGILVSAVKWYAINSDYAGWIKIPGADVDCALVQADDNQYYLKRNFYKQSTRYGCPFVSCTNNLRTLDQNTTVFGHNMENDDLLFGKLEQYLTVDGYKKAPIIEFSTPYADYKCKIYAVFITNSKEKDDNGYCFYYFFDNLRNTKNFDDYIRNLDQRKLYSTGVDINAEDKLLTLSTCSYDFDDARLVVVARLVRPDESEQVNISSPDIRINESPRYPQAWYDAKKKTNPYKNAELWYKD